MPFLTGPEIFLNRSRRKEENGLASCSLLGSFGPRRSPHTASSPGPGTVLPRLFRPAYDADAEDKGKARHPGEGPTSTPINSAGLHLARGDGARHPSTVDVGVKVTQIILLFDST